MEYYKAGVKIVENPETGEKEPMPDINETVDFIQIKWRNDYNLCAFKTESTCTGPEVQEITQAQFICLLDGGGWPGEN